MKIYSFGSLKDIIGYWFENTKKKYFFSMALLTIIMMSAMVSILFTSLVFGQSSIILKNSEKLENSSQQQLAT